MSLVERFVVGVDMQRYSARNARRQLALQRDLDRMLSDAADAAGASRSLWSRMPEGDGEIALLPSDVDLPAVVRRFVSELDLRLTDHNEDHAPETRMRLRVAMHSGVLTPGALGYAGPALVVLQRLLVSPPVRSALTETPEVNLAQIISESVFEKAVVPELGGLRPRQFRKVRVDLPAKDFHQTAYLHVPGEPPPRLPALPAPGLIEIIRQAARNLQQPRREVTAPDIPALESLPDPPVLTPAVRELAHEVRESLSRKDIERADTLTTLAMLASVGRGAKGWLRESDGHEIPDALLTELDEAWVDFSSGSWGFHAQRRRLNGLPLSGRREFRALSVLVGWRGDEEEILPRYAKFALRGDLTVPFYPTLRNPGLEEHSTWHDEWLATVMSVHVRLQGWER